MYIYVYIYIYICIGDTEGSETEAVADTGLRGSGGDEA